MCNVLLHCVIQQLCLFETILELNIPFYDLQLILFKVCNLISAPVILPLMASHTLFFSICTSFTVRGIRLILVLRQRLMDGL